MPENTDLPQPIDMTKEVSAETSENLISGAPNPQPEVKIPGKSNLFLAPILAALGVVVLGGFIIMTLAGKIKDGSDQNSITPTSMPNVAPSSSPAILRTPSAIASQSAFLELDAAINSLNAGITGYVVQDLTLSPPVLDLKLGFTN